MTASDLLVHAQSVGAVLWVDGELLRWKCPGGLPDDIKRGMASWKADLMELLAANDSTPSVPSAANNPTSCAQCRYFWPGVAVERGHCAPRYRTVAGTETCEHFTARRVGEWTQSTEVTA